MLVLEVEPFKSNCKDSTDPKLPACSKERERGRGGERARGTRREMEMKSQEQSHEKRQGKQLLHGRLLADASEYGWARGQCTRHAQRF